MDYLFVDTETGGLNPQDHSLLTLAAIRTDESFVEKERYTFEFICDVYHVTPKALSVNKINIEDLALIGVPYGMARPIFTDCILAGWNVQFDRGFIDYYINPARLSHRMLDVQSIYMFNTGAVTGLYGAAQRLALPEPDHTALQDVLVTLEIARYFRNL